MAKLMFHILFFLCSLLLLSVSEAAASPYPTYPLTKNSNCRDHCGNITIPFPFGIGADCFLEEWYEILCNNNVPILNKLGLQVLDISLPHNSDFGDWTTTITVNYPIVRSSRSCRPTHHGTDKPATFQGSPFFFSWTSNIFVAAGCENVAMLKGLNHSFVGCRTDCKGSNMRHNSSCDGFDCCQSTIPYGLQGFSVDFQGEENLETGGGHHDCQFAFLVDSTWFDPNLIDLYAIRDGGNVPAVLLWGIIDAAFPKSIGLEPRSRPFYESESALCYNNSNINANITTFMNCLCIPGFYGNPYVEGGCQDINECEIPLLDGSMRCGGLHWCRNMAGSYYCIKGGRKTLFIVLGLCLSVGLLLLIILTWWTRRLINKRRESS